MPIDSEELVWYRVNLSDFNAKGGTEQIAVLEPLPLNKKPYYLAIGLEVRRAWR
jgi:hypothetical protein